MKKIMLLVLCGMMLGNAAIAQRQCGAEMIKDNLINRDPANAAKLIHRSVQIKAQTEAYTTTYEGAKLKTTSGVTIPVVFHIILTSAQQTQIGGTTGIIQRLQSQLNVLNEDFEKRNTDTNLIPTAFKPLAANTQIQYGLAHRKPDGTSTPGYQIITTTTNTFVFPAINAKTTSQGGADAWDPNRYLNIWVLNLGGALLGFTVPRSLVGMGYSFQELGVVLNFGAFGKRSSQLQYFLSGYDRGRTLTHEVGHYFELEHTWGDDNGQCPATGGIDDGIADTPPQASESTGNPVYPKLDACSPNSPGVMFMNYMDYSNDASLYMFTTGQSNRMNSMLVPTGSQDHELTTHPELLDWPTTVNGVNAERSIEIYPNPSNGIFTITTSSSAALKQIDVLNIVGSNVYSISTNNAGFLNYNVDLTGMSKGVYMVRCTFATGTITRKIVLQ